MRVSLHNSHSSARAQLAFRQRAPKEGLKGGRYRRYPAAERFWARVDKRGPDECWFFAGAPGHNAGHIHIVRDDGTRAYAHRFAWELVHGTIADGLRICHTCDQPRCVNVAHLFVGTQGDNVRDSIHKGRYNCFGKQKLNATQVLEIRALAAEGVPHAALGQRFGIARHSVWGIVHRKSWAHLPAVGLGDRLPVLDQQVNEAVDRSR